MSKEMALARSFPKIRNIHCTHNYKSSPRNENMNLLVQNKVLLVLGWITNAHREDCKSQHLIPIMMYMYYYTLLA